MSIRDMGPRTTLIIFARSVARRMGWSEKGVFGVIFNDSDRSEKRAGEEGLVVATERYLGTYRTTRGRSTLETHCL